MMRALTSKSAWVFAAGLSAGLLLGLAVVVGVVVGGSQRTTGEMTLTERFLREHPLHASGATGGKSIALATGVIDEGTEGVFVLDFLTGDLQCWVLNPRVGQFSNWFKTNVIADLGVEQGKTPDYVMSTGVVDVRGQVTIGRSVVYVADGNTGNVACYAVPWSRAASTASAAQAGAMARIGPVLRSRLVALQE